MNSQTQNSLQPLPLFKKIELAQLLALFVAFPFLLFARWNVGYRTVKPIALLIMAAIMIGSSVLLPIGNTKAVIIYALAMVAAGVIHRIIHWRQICRRVKRHTYSPGISYLELPFLSEFFFRERRIYRFLDPMLCFLLCWFLLAIGLHGVAFWLAISGMATIVFEQGFYDRLINMFLDEYDGLINATAQGEIVKSLSANPQAMRKALNKIGLTSGIAEDILARIEEMKAKSESAQPTSKAASQPQLPEAKA